MFYKDGSANLHFQAYLDPNVPVEINTFHHHHFAFTVPNDKSQTILHELSIDYKILVYPISFEKSKLEQGAHDEL